jgi:hypothetical protein
VASKPFADPESFIGRDLRLAADDVLNMWRWLRVNPVELDTRPTYEIHPEAMDVRTWLGSGRG